MSGTKLLLVLIVVVLALWAGTFVVVSYSLPGWQERGQFGDLFGSINALFSGLAFAGLIATIFLQREELALQREELKLQREEMALSRAELAKQATVQQSLFLATLGQIRVAAVQVEVEAIRMEAEQVTPGYRDTYVTQIKDAGKVLAELASKIEELAKQG